MILRIMGEVEIEMHEAICQRDELSDTCDELTCECDLYAVQLAWNNTRGSLAAEVSESKKLMKIPDPPLFGDGKTISFEDWLLAMQQKLEVNADHLSIAAIRRVYVTSRCEGDARKYLLPRLRPEAPNLLAMLADNTRSSKWWLVISFTALCLCSATSQWRRVLLKSIRRRTSTSASC
ncbi:hypothetical protein ASPBRDRAFT_316832 [Aspergillus brasiliensis CBS 101740]|uniref:Uncharacterized protein n=1 Tax=Aspergillus brasiliensis (strain CBS 101740 / IMI 381727 / IBT 21946) TaxID=767769 RepID=A0A1L9U8S5_ASPBC|nr:hypothetical protein ASPBRDRAFT_316832 [Aspergillus brasiliensis CBS 101740]